MYISKKSIRIEKVLFIISIAAMCQPNGSGVFHNIYSILKIIGLCYAVVIMINKQFKVDKFICALLGYFLYLLVITWDHGGNFNVWFMQFYMYVSTCIIISYWIKKNPRETMSVLTMIFAIYLLLNLFTFFQLGFDHSELGLTESKIYWLGIRTRISDSMFLAISCALIASWIKNTLGSKIILCLIIFSSVYFSVVNAVSTAILVSVIFCLLYQTLKTIKKVPDILSKVAVFIGPIMTVLLLSINFIDKFSYIIENLLGESLTLNGRTLIWENVILKLQESWLTGFGVGSNKSFKVVTGTTGATHNGYLDIMYSGGIIGSILFAFIVILVISRLKYCRNQKLKAILVTLLLATSIVMVSEVANTCAYYFIMLVLVYNVEALDDYLSNQNE